MKIAFKNLLLVLGLVAIFASVVQQSFDDFIDEPVGNSQSSFGQLENDNNRDAGDAMAAIEILPNQFSQLSTVYFFYSTDYLEPTPLLQLRPPNA